MVLGHSAGAVLALLAAGAGVPMTHLLVSEPPLRFGEDEPPADLAERLQTLVDQGQLAEAVLTFQRENVRLSEPMIEQLQESPDFPGLVSLAQTTVYDTLLIASVSTPTPAMLGPAPSHRRGGDAVAYGVDHGRVDRRVQAKVVAVDEQDSSLRRNPKSCVDNRPAPCRGGGGIE